MKAKEIREKTKEDILKMIKENSEKLRQLRFDLISRKLKNVREIGAIKKETARLQTVLKEKK